MRPRTADRWGGDERLPDELFQAARIDGASECRIFFRVAVPLSQPIFATLTIFTFFQRYLVGSIALTGIKG